MGLVEEIENLQPQLHIHPVGFLEDLVRRKIDIVIPGPREGAVERVVVGRVGRVHVGVQGRLGRGGDTREVPSFERLDRWSCG